MKNLVFDTGPVITLAMNNLLWLLEPLKSRFSGEFYLPPAVKKELVDKPLKTKKFKFESLQVLKHINKGVLRVVDNGDLKQVAYSIQELANNCYKAKGHYIKIVHSAEIEAVALALQEKSEAIVIDERTTRYLIEKPDQIKDLLKHKLHTKIRVNHDNLKELRKKLCDLKVVRSVELITIAYETGLLDFYITEGENNILPDPRYTLLESVLWGAKLRGCAISRQEIDSILKLELNRI